MNNRRRDYLSYLLRLWRTGTEEDGIWVASLTNPFTGERLGFASLRDLLDFLESRVDEKECQAWEEERSAPGA